MRKVEYGLGRRCSGVSRGLASQNINATGIPTQLASDGPLFPNLAKEGLPTIHSQPRPSLPPRYDPRLLRMQLHAAVVSGIGLPLRSSGAMRASLNYATFTESSVPLLERQRNRNKSIARIANKLQKIRLRVVVHHIPANAKLWSDDLNHLAASEGSSSRGQPSIKAKSTEPPRSRSVCRASPSRISA